MKLSEIIKKLEEALKQGGDNEVEAIDLPPLPEGKEGWTLDLRYS